MSGVALPGQGIAVLAWTLTLPVVFVALALLFVWWRGRPRRPAKAVDSVAEYQRFRQALETAERREVN
ncbi:MAG TPA: hypothetical protein VNG13_02635 [Mycobacteriales bacterium]|nr:hypothetical protein [Mycobacteriales bacterium]